MIWMFVDCRAVIAAGVGITNEAFVHIGKHVGLHRIVAEP